MRILVIGDLHGRKPIIKIKDFDCMVVVGDVCDDSKIGPLYKKYFKLFKENPNLEFGADSFFISEIGKRKFKQYERESLEEGYKILKYLDSFGKPIFMIAGNWDQSYGPTKIKNLEESDYTYRKAFYDFYLGDKINPKLIKGLKNIKNCMYKNNELKGINFFGYGLSSAPEKTGSRKKKLKLTKKQITILKKSYNKLFDKLVRAFNKIEKRFPLIFITHDIPYNTKLDVGKDKKSHVYGKHLGSTIARKFCEKYQPLICVGGHIHEGKGKDKIGKTIVLNPGFGQNAQILIDIDEDKNRVRKIKFS